MCSSSGSLLSATTAAGSVVWVDWGFWEASRSSQTITPITHKIDSAMACLGS